MKKNTKIFLFFGLCMGLIGCSGDDAVNTTDDGPVDEPIVQTGIFRDSEVSGIHYATETQSGTTSAQGEFTYLEGETVTFSVGEIELGKAVAASEMTPVTIASDSNATLSTPEVKNIAAFLQTLDSDSDPSNGISIETAVVEAISNTSIDFTAPIVQLLGEIVAEVNQKTGAELKPVYPEQAAQHLSETLGETYESEDWVFKNFVPTIESWTSYPQSTLHWIHETDENGNLEKSYMYEEHPYRVLSEYTYTEINEDGLPLEYEQTYYSYGVANRTLKRKLTYTEENQIERLVYHNIEGTQTSYVHFAEFNNDNRVTEARSYSSTGDFLYKEVYVLQENGNNTSKTRYSSESGTNEADIIQRNEFEYTDFGEVKKNTFIGPNAFSVEEFFYRNNKTLEETVKNINYTSGKLREEVTEFDEQEKRTKLIITEGDYRTEYLSFYENGDPHIAETYFKDFLYEIVIWNEDGSSTWKIIEQNDNSYRIEYKDSDGKVNKIEYYNSSGELISTNTM